MLAVEEPNQLGALSVGEATDRLRLADAARVQEAGRLHPAELGHGHQHVEHLRGRHVLGRVAEDLVDLDKARPSGPSSDWARLHPDVVRPLERLHALVEGADRRLGLGIFDDTIRAHESSK